MTRKRKPARIIPVFKKGPEHAGHADGYVVHPDDRAARPLPTPPEKVSAEPDDDTEGPR